VPHSFLKSPYFKPRGFPEGTYRVGPLARLNVIARCGTEAADIEFDEYHQRFGKSCRARSTSITHA
jgi:NAD-reducing hydrogenase large subunit